MLPSALGVLVVTLLKMLTRTRKRVMSKAIRPGMTSGGTTKLIHDTTTKRPKGKTQKLICVDITPCSFEAYLGKDHLFHLIVTHGGSIDYIHDGSFSPILLCLSKFGSNLGCSQ